MPHRSRFRNSVPGNKVHKLRCVRRTRAKWSKGSKQYVRSVRSREGRTLKKLGGVQFKGKKQVISISGSKIVDKQFT